MDTASNTLVLQEKWSVYVKKHPIVYSILLLFAIMPLIASFVMLGNAAPSDSAKAMLVMGVVSFVFFGLLCNISVIKRIVSPKRYEVSVEGGRIVVVKNGKEVLNARGQQITYLKFMRNNGMLGNDLLNLRIDYEGEESKTKRYMLGLAFIPKAQGEELFQQVSLFYMYHVNQSKQTDGENWTANFFIALFITVASGYFYLYTDKENDKTVIIFIASLVFLVFSLVKLLSKKK